METINEYNKAIVDILRNTINNPEELDEFNKDVEDTMDCASDDEEFLDNMLWEYATEDRFGLQGYGIHVEVAKQHPELKEQARDIIKSEIETPDRSDWLQRCDFYFEDICDLKEEVDWFVKKYNQLQEWEKYFNIEFNLNEFNLSVADYLYNNLIYDFDYPPFIDVLRRLPKDVFYLIYDKSVVYDLGNEDTPGETPEQEDELEKDEEER